LFQSLTGTIHTVLVSGELLLYCDQFQSLTGTIHTCLTSKTPALSN